MNHKKVGVFTLSTVLVATSVIGLGHTDVYAAKKKGDKTKYKYTMAMQNFGPWDKNPEMVERWEKEYGVDFDLKYVESSSAADQINLMVSSGDVPGVLQNIDFNKYYQDGVIGGWSEDFFRKHAPNISKYIDETDKSAWDISKFDGKNMYSIPCFRIYDTYATPIVWRNDWLKKVGINEIPKTIDQFEDAFYKFTKDDPDGDGKNNTYGLSQTGIGTIYGAFGSYRSKWLLDKNGKVAYGDIKPEMKDALKLLQKWYKDGVIDPEFASGENEGGYWAITHKFLNNVIGYTNMGSFYHWVPDMRNVKNGSVVGEMTAQWENSGNKGTYDFGYAPEGPSGDKGTDMPDARKIRTAFSAELVKDKAKFGRLLEIIDDMNCSSVEKSMEVTKGTKGKYSDIVDFEGRQSYMALDRAQKSDRAAFLSSIGAANTFAFIEEGGNLDYQKVAYAQQLSWAEKTFKDKNDGYKSVIFRQPESQAKYGAECDKILNTGYISIITGEKPVSYFDDMVKQWKKAGGDQLTKEANEIYKAETKK